MGKQGIYPEHHGDLLVFKWMDGNTLMYRTEPMVLKILANSLYRHRDIPFQQSYSLDVDRQTFDSADEWGDKAWEVFRMVKTYVKPAADGSQIDEETILGKIWRDTEFVDGRVNVIAEEYALLTEEGLEQAKRLWNIQIAEQGKPENKEPTSHESHTP